MIFHFLCLHFLLLTILSEELKFKIFSSQKRHNLSHFSCKMEISARSVEVMHRVGVEIITPPFDSMPAPRLSQF